MKNATLRAMIMALAMVAGLMAAATPAWADLVDGGGDLRTTAPKVDTTTSDNDGDADSDESTTVTEETDTNDGADGNVDEDTDNEHPSGNDRSTESGSSGNQGKAESNPDDSKGPQRYEGAKGDDKPGGPGGEDLADQDGNNGCGNDDDFDDDNNGHCGKPADTKTCSDGNAHGWECNGGGNGGNGGGGGSSVGASGSTTCPNKHMGGDDSGNGANTSGAYDSTCDGSPSGNGNGTGGRGKPCAGCVGNADDKNPPGQAPDGSDSNKGYECDENSGVGKTNPAHSGCTPPPAVISNPVEPDVLGRTDHACPAGTDNAGKKMSNPKDCNDDSVLGTMIRNAGPAGVAATKVAAAVGAVLPFTGAGDLAAFLVLAGCLIAGGIMMMRKKREVGSEA